MSEFLNRQPLKETVDEAVTAEELDVQKAVVESLAADKAEQDEKIVALQRENNELKSKVAQLEEAVASMRESLAKVGDVLATNADGEMSNKVTLLERDPELSDRFLGETREQVLEVIQAAHAAAEAEGRIRRAQILESVLVANSPTGELRKKRCALEKFFSDNGNLLTGSVMAELDKCGISYKKGEEFLMPSEIIHRTY